MHKIPIYQPHIGKKEKEYVQDCLNSSWISSKGKYIEMFEDEFAKFVDIKHATTVSNGTVALHLALLSIGIKDGDEVIVPSLTYVASVNAIKYIGAKPVFIDSLIDTWQLDPSKLENAITTKTKAIMVAHLYGMSCDMTKIMAIAKRYKLKVVEDCAEAFGTKFKNRHVGTFGDVSAFSFFGNKTITTGEGGMVVSNSNKIIDLARRIKGQGLAKNTEYWHDILGYNYRMTNICAAIGLAQLESANKFIQRKRNIAELYIMGLKGLPITVLTEPQYVYGSYWMISILFENSKVRTIIRKKLTDNNVETRPVFYPINSLPMYKDGVVFKNALFLSKRGINLPSFPDLTDKQINYICKTIRDYYDQLSFRKNKHK